MRIEMKIIMVAIWVLGILILLYTLSLMVGWKQDAEAEIYYPPPQVSPEHNAQCYQCLKPEIPTLEEKDAFGFYYWLLMKKDNASQSRDPEWIAGKWHILSKCKCDCVRSCEAY